MFLTTDFTHLGSVPQEVIANLQELALSLDWSKKDFDRNEILTTRIVRVPYGIRQERPQELTYDVQRVLDEFKTVDQWMHTLYPDHTFIKCEIACLMPGDKLLFHVDPCWWHEHSHRIHVPIISNPDCFWCIEDREHYFDVGQYYEVNNRIYHTYCNRGDTFRLHLIFDIIENSKYQQALDNGIDISSMTFDTEFLPHTEFLAKLPELKQLHYH